MCAKSSVELRKPDFVDHAGNHCFKRIDGSLDVVSINESPSMTIQSEKDNCDINKIVSKFKSTGVMTNLNTRKPLDVDFSDVVDFHTAMNSVTAAQEAFSGLPSQIRKRFGNDPGQLITFLEDSTNLDEAVKLGLVKAPQAQSKPQGEVTPPVAPGG